MADTVKSAGWVLSVLFKTSSGPSAMSFESEKPRISSACCIIFLAGSKVEARVWPIPTYWAPWPGKSKIVLDILYIPLRSTRIFCSPQI